MTRKFPLVALAIAVTACGDSPRRDVIVYWDFLRHTQTQGDVRYDANKDVGGGDAACEEAGVDYITLTDQGGRPVREDLPQVPCVFGGVQGVQLDDVGGGTHSWILTGYRLGATAADDVPTYVTTLTFDAAGGSTVFDVTLAGIQDDLDLVAVFNDAAGTTQPWATCAEAQVDRLEYSLVDGAGVEVAAGAIPCTDPAGVLFRNASGTGIDRDSYSVRMQAFRSSDPLPILDSATFRLAGPGGTTCEAPVIHHLGPDTGALGWLIDLFDVTQNETLCR
jgi:hypothetical protein